MSRAVPPRRELSFSAVEAETGLTLHRSPAQLRLEVLQKEHARLLREIAKKKSVREATGHAARDAASVLDAKLRPLREAFLTILAELRGIFEALLSDHSRLNRRDKAKVRRWYHEVLPDLAIGTHADGAADHENDVDPSYRPHAGRSGAPFSNTGDAGYSAAKPSEKNASSLRALFRRLAVTLHPDKVRDEEEREALTSVMKEVTRAYETGDLARLLEIERDWLAASTPRGREDEIGWRVGQLLQANKELRRQLRTLTAEIKELKQFLPDVVAPKPRGARTPERLVSHTEQVVREMERELDQLRIMRDFARSFLDAEIDTAEFLLGPSLAMEQDQVFQEFLAEIFDSVDAPPRPTRASGSGRRAR